MISLSILPNSPTPVYRQITDQISSQILSGAIPGGTPLPPIRSVSKELGVSVITVRRAWEELEKDGFIVTRAGSGCYACDITQLERARLCSAMIEEQLKSAVDEAKRMNVSRDELIEMIKAYYKD